MIDEITAAEREWLETQLANARQLVLSVAGTSDLAVENLQAAWDAWLSLGETDTTNINTVINALGIAFGQSLADGGQLQWVIATDQQGSDLALHGFPGTADVLIYPANLIAKRWEIRERGFMVPLFRQIRKQINDVAISASAADPPES